MTNRSSTARNRRPRRAFTLVELLVAIGAVALVAVGIAAIFESIGDTVSGGRRVSQLNQYAALIERQMRADFGAMSRDGVLVIKHNYADADGDGVIDLTGSSDHVLNAPTQRAGDGRIRRTDELLFFTRGDFTSARTPVVPGFNARANEAMIYYGHGIRLDPVEDVVGRNMGGGQVRYDRPQVSDGVFSNSPGAVDGDRRFDAERALGYLDSSYTTNPNRFAGDWTLLRHVTLLGQPNSADRNLPVDNAFWDDLGFRTSGRFAALDSEVQLGSQPAAASAFSHVAAVLPQDLDFPFIRTEVNADRERLPSRASGLVDAATSDLAEIRRIIMDAGEFPWEVFADPAMLDPTGPAYILDDEYSATLNLNDPNNNLLHMHAWMQDLLPVVHDQRSPIASPDGVRVRYETQVPDYVGTLTIYSDDRTSRYPFIQNFRLADQRMLGSSVFVPRCTEFIVEYSFGQTVQDQNNPFFGQLIWYGLQRQLDAEDGSPYDVVRPYPFDTTSGLEVPYQMPYSRLDGTPGSRLLTPEMLYGVEEPFNAESLVAHFGYNDPTYSPQNQDDPATVPWPWPKLIRVTMTLADPIDPSIEQSFQFVFETPEGDAL